MKKLIYFIGLTLIINVTCAQHESHYFPPEDPLVVKKLEQWQDLKFGLLMHWGTYSQWGIVESWSICPEDYGWCKREKGSNPDNYFEYVREYENLKSTFNPIDFDPDRWATAARYAGMKYVIFTTKHHDGFCMFDSKYTDYKITDPGCPFSTHPKSNVTNEIFRAFRDQGFWTGAYFSKPDWHSDFYWWPEFPPLDRNVNYDPAMYPERWKSFVEFTHNQILELMTDYGRVDILWLDGGWVSEKTRKEIVESTIRHIEESDSRYPLRRYVNQDIRMDELVDKCREKQPGLIVVDRAVTGPNQNYLTPENRVPEKQLPYPWESCIIAGGGWSWVENPEYMSSRELVHMLADIVAKGGNLLLNIAPGPQGQWHDLAYEQLAEVGDWMEVNSEAIYNTRAIEPFKEFDVCYTFNHSSGTMFAIYVGEEEKIPAEIQISFTVLKKGSKIYMLGYKEPLDWKVNSDGLFIQIPENLQNKPPCKYAWTFKIKPAL